MENTQDRARYIVTHFTGLTKSNRGDVCFSSCSQVSTTQSKTDPRDGVEGEGMWGMSMYVYTCEHPCAYRQRPEGDVGGFYPTAFCFTAGRPADRRELSESSCLHSPVLQVQPYLAFSHGWLRLQTQDWGNQLPTSFSVEPD